MPGDPARGEIWLVNLDPTIGREQAGERPVVILSTDRFNRGPAGLVIVAPMTTRDRRLPLHVAVDPPEGGGTQALLREVRGCALDLQGPVEWYPVGRLIRPDDG